MSKVTMFCGKQRAMELWQPSDSEDSTEGPEIFYRLSNTIPWSVAMDKVSNVFRVSVRCIATGNKI